MNVHHAHTRRETVVDIEEARRASRLVDIERGVVSRKIFADEDIYRMELKQIFARCWLYLAHESEIPNPGDFVGVNMGEEPVLVARDRDGSIHAFINSCRHRGNRVCRVDKGNTRSFTCPYHGWVYNTRGDLVSVPGQKALYHDQLNRSDWGLASVAQVSSYRGLIFGTFDVEAVSLETYLGEMRWGLDMLLDQGDLVAVPGIGRWVMNCNWKFAADNAIGDMYHGLPTHRSAFLVGHVRGQGVTQTGAFAPYDNDHHKGITVMTEYGHGFTANLPNEGELNIQSPMQYWRRDPGVTRTLGPVRSNIVRSNMNVFPNLFVNSGSRDLLLRNPLGPTQTEMWKTVLVDRNAPEEIQRELVRGSNRHFGPAGMFEQEDGENWDQSTYGARSPVAQLYDLNYSMGMGHGEVVLDKDGMPPHVDTLVNEHCQLWLYRCWSEYMRAENWPELERIHSRPSGRI